MNELFFFSFSCIRQTHGNMNVAANMGKIKRSHRKTKTQKSESEEYDSLGSDTESGSAEHIRSRLEQSMTLDEHESTNFISKISIESNNFMN